MPNDKSASKHVRSELPKLQRKNRKNRIKLIRYRNYEAKLKPNIVKPTKAEIKRAKELKYELRLTA